MLDGYLSNKASFTCCVDAVEYPSSYIVEQFADQIA